MPASVLDVIVFPQPSAEICLFWQNTHRRTQPEKKTAPEPHVPDMHGSSHLCSAALATRSTCSIPSIPPSAYPGIAHCSLQSRPLILSVPACIFEFILSQSAKSVKVPQIFLFRHSVSDHSVRTAFSSLFTVPAAKAGLQCTLSSQKAYYPFLPPHAILSGKSHNSQFPDR